MERRLISVKVPPNRRNASWLRPSVVERSKLSGLPHWETLPADTSAAIVEIKAAIRERIAASGRTPVEDVVAEVEEFLRAEVADIQATRKRGEEVWPIIDYADIEAGTVSSGVGSGQAPGLCGGARALPRDLAEQWDRDIVEYVDSNHFFESYAGRPTTSSATWRRRSRDLSVYWSRAQMERVSTHGWPRRSRS